MLQQHLEFSLYSPIFLIHWAGERETTFKTQTRNLNFHKLAQLHRMERSCFALYQLKGCPKPLQKVMGTGELQLHWWRREDMLRGAARVVRGHDCLHTN